LHPEIEKVPFEKIEKLANRFYSLAIKRRNWFRRLLRHGTN
jgi:hypothetical protein